MKRILVLFLLSAALLAACGTAAQPAATPTSSLPPASPTVTAPPPTEIPSATPTAPPPADEFGPAGFPAGVNPLTGLAVPDPALLERRPLLIKVSNLPRSVRPQWGLSLADLVFEYYTEEGSTRFAALFYGNDAGTVGPIRSARFVDAHLIRGYKAAFAFGSAYQKVLERLFSSEFADRLVIEGSSTPLKRYDPNGMNQLVVDTAALSAYITQKGVENGRQNLDGMFFKRTPPTTELTGSGIGEHVTVRYSGSIYNRWDYDPASGRYLRSADKADDFSGGLNEQYALQTDRLNDQPLAFDNVVVLYVLNEYYSQTPEVLDIQLVGSGNAYLFRDGKAYQVTWKRDPNSVLTLLDPNGNPFPFKPGTTWFEIVGLRTVVQEDAAGWRFTHHMP